MKKLSFISVFTIAAFLLLSASSSMAAQKLTYANFFPPTHIQSILAESWCKDVEKVTNGEVTIQYYPAGTLLKPRQIYDGVEQGIADIGSSALAYTPGRFPVMGTIDMPLGYPSGVVATKVANEVYNKFQPKEFKKVKLMFLHAHGPGMIFTARKPVQKLEELSGMKLRGTPMAAKIITALGGSPVGGPMTEAYQNIQKGVVDGGMYPMETNKGWKMGEVVDYGTAAYDIAYTTTFYVAMNKSKWNKLSKKAQNAIMKLNEKYIELHGKAWDESDAVGLREFLNQGNQLIGLDKKEVARWKSAVSPIIDDYVKELDKKRLNGRAIVDFTVQTVNGMK